MHALIINGARNHKGQTAKATKAFAAGWKRGGNTVEEVFLPEMAIERCRQCNADGWGLCWDERRCAIEDDFAALVKKLRKADVAVFATPVYFSDLSESMKAFLDRLRRIAFKWKGRTIMGGKRAVGICVAGGGGGGAPMCSMLLQRTLDTIGFDVVDMVPARRQNLATKVVVLKETGKSLAQGVTKSFRTGRNPTMLKTLLAFTVIALAFVAVSCVSMAAEAPSWDGLALESSDVGGVTFHYEKALSTYVPEMAAMVTANAAEGAQCRAKAEYMAAKGAIFEEIDSLVGPTGNHDFVRTRPSLFVGFATPTFWASDRLRHVYLVRKATIKGYLRSGGSLPHFSYDRGTDMAHYSMPDADFDGTFTFPFDEPEKAPDELRGFLAANRPAPFVGVAFREVTEAAILLRLRAADPHMRWFSDGFANAVAARLLAEHIGRDAADAFAATYRIEPVRGMERDVTLRYWCFRDFAVETPLESEGKLELARHAFAAARGQLRLIDAHGMGCLKAILDRLPAEGTRAEDLLAAIKAVTGEDMDARLARYQGFATCADGIALYSAQCDAAIAKRDTPAALVATLRMTELAPQYMPAAYSQAASFLRLMGAEDYGTRMFLKQMDILTIQGDARLLHDTRAFFVAYALRCKDPSAAAAASGAAGALLAADPNDAPALAVRLISLIRSGDNAEAARTAAHILAVDKDTSSKGRAMARDFLDLHREVRVDSSSAGVSLESSATVATSEAGCMTRGVR